jgi:hypothetical protein
MNARNAEDGTTNGFLEACTRDDGAHAARL